MLRIFFICLITLSASTVFFLNAQGTWTAIANYPSAVENAVGISIGSKGYVGLGNNASNSVTDWWEYDPATGLWSQMASFPGGARIKTTGMGIGNKGFVGLGMEGLNNFKDWWEYNPSSNSWLQKTNYPGGGSYTTTSFVIQGKGYVGTGATITLFETVYKDFWEYDPIADSWTQKADFGGVKRRHAMSFAIGCKGYLGCGWDQSAFSWYKDIWEYVPQTNTWTQKADFPFVSEGGAGFAIGNKGYIGLGESSVGLSNQFNEYNPATNTWSAIPNLPGVARNRTAWFVIDSIGYVGTGGANSGMNDFYKYSPASYGPPGPCCLMQLSDTFSNAACGNANGTATVTATSGSTPYNYLWSDGQTTQTATGLTPGSYIVTVSDNGSCSDTTSVTVGATNIPIAIITPSTITLCSGGSAIISASGGATYLWSTGDTTSLITVSPTSTTTYSVTATNTCGSDSAQITVNVGAGTLSVTTSATVASCGQCNGTATATATGGTGSYSYLWNNGQTIQTATGLCSGNYTVTVSEGGGSSMTSFWTEDFTSGGTLWTLNTLGTGINGAVKNFWVVNALTGCNCGTGNTLHITCDQTNFVCQSSSGGVADCFYNAGPAFMGDPSTDVIAISPAISTVGKTNINLKFKWIADGEVGDDFGKLRLSNDGGSTWTELATSYSGAFSCGQDSITLPAIYDNITNFKIAFRWQNSANGNGGDPPFGIDDIELSSPSGGSLCTSINSVTVTSSSSVTSSVAANNTSCSGNTGSALVNASGGSTPYTYLWSSGQTTTSITGLATGNYYVTVTDFSGCTSIDTAIINSTGAPTAGITGNNVSCNGGNNGSANTIVNGGTSPYTYLWSNGQSTSSATGLVAGNYSVTITDNSNCTAISTVTISQPTAISVTTNADSASCGMADGSISVSVNGGASPYSFLWNNGQTGDSATALIAGTYSVTVTDANGCTQAVSESVSNAGAPTATISVTNPTCSGGNNGTASVTANNGTPPYNYLWNNGSTQPQISNLSPQICLVTVTDDNNCQTVVSDTVSDPLPVQVQFPGGIDADTICLGDSSVITASGGTSYVWSSGGTLPTITVSPAISTEYIVTATDDSSCSGVDTFFVTVISPSVTASCSGTNITLTASQGNSYSWSTNETTQSITVSPTSTTSYFVTITASCGQLTDTITVSPPVSAVVSNDTTIEYGTTIQLVASGGVNYLWSTGASGSGITVNPTENTAYTVTITDANGCTDTAIINISIKDEGQSISVPTVFTPNNDLINDHIKVFGYGVKEYKFVIFDRWGEKIFEDQGALLIHGTGAEWDGSYKGKQLNPAVFAYFLDAVFVDETEIHEKGNITLLR